MKVVYNACFGGFSLSPEAMLLLWKRGMKEIGTPVEEYYPPEDRKSRAGILGYQHAIDQWREYAEMTPKQRKSERRKLAIVEIPDDVKWHVDEYDGNEHIAEDHRTWS